ncbi:phytanoyl-CoA dioxygenase family protein [Reyranella sp.]|uniref:phytanoyl-CoA dioxygenase family protein n=1 Tax=Reyranella sp. TaxID=1929291 RepID=UPI003BAD382F
MAGRLPPAFNASPHLLMPWLWDIVHDRRLIDPIEEILGPDILCYGSSFIMKRPQDRKFVSWHQDATYWGLSSPEAVTAWIALTPSDRDSGCVKVLPGTHLRQHDHVDTRDPLNLLGRREKVVADIDAGQAVDLVLQPGQMSLHHVLVIHGSEPNLSKEPRVGFAVRFIPGHVGPRDGLRMSATLVRGRNRGSCHLEEPPEGDFHPAAVARHAQMFRRAMRVIFAGAGRAAPGPSAPRDGR